MLKKSKTKPNKNQIKLQEVKITIYEIRNILDDQENGKRSHTLEKIFAKNINLIKKMLSKLYKEPLKLNNKNQTTQLKKGKDLYRNLLKEDIRHISLRTEHLNNDVIMLHTCCNGPHPKL